MRKGGKTYKTNIETKPAIYSVGVSKNVLIQPIYNLTLVAFTCRTPRGNRELRVLSLQQLKPPFFSLYRSA